MFCYDKPGTRGKQRHANNIKWEVDKYKRSHFIK